MTQPDPRSQLNRQDLLLAAVQDIDAGDAPSSNYQFKTMLYVAAIAKILLAETMPEYLAEDAGDEPEPGSTHCTVCAHPRYKCTCADDAPASPAGPWTIDTVYAMQQQCIVCNKPRSRCKCLGPR